VKRYQQAGFTLVELVLVIVILGILSAVAMPKFAGVNRDARVAAVNTMRAALITAAALVKAKCMVDPVCAAQVFNYAFTINGVAYHVFDGYPSSNGTITNMGAKIDELVSMQGFTAAFVPWNYVFSLNSAQDPSQCAVLYGLGSEPSLTVVTTGC